jgi:hypothetical protein
MQIQFLTVLHNLYRNLVGAALSWCFIDGHACQITCVCPSVKNIMTSVPPDEGHRLYNSRSTQNPSLGNIRHLQLTPHETCANMTGTQIRQKLVTHTTNSCTNDLLPGEHHQWAAALHLFHNMPSHSDLGASQA